ncbi:Uncharacterized protein OBRU01_09498, partial [Operophtera brumata]
EFVNEKEDCKKIREINAKLEVELKESRELEKSHRYQLLSAREMIGNLQETVSQLRLEELEEKLKQTQFKQYLAQSTYGSLYEGQVDRSYSAQRDYEHSVDINPVLERSTPKLPLNKAMKPSTLQVMYYGNKNTSPNVADKKGQFNITKKRKLYNEKDYQDF